jgi:hypothetical protein
MLNPPFYDRETSKVLKSFAPVVLNVIVSKDIYIYIHVSLKYNQQDATFSRSIYFYKSLYMFQAFPPPIIRSTKLYTQRQVLSNQYCCLLHLIQDGTVFRLIHDNSKQQYWFDNT